jgi:hypothetical protein
VERVCWVGWSGVVRCWVLREWMLPWWLWASGLCLVLLLGGLGGVWGSWLRYGLVLL